jgi:DNA-binding NarL/FixJ family response regulator
MRSNEFHLRHFSSDRRPGSRFQPDESQLLVAALRRRPEFHVISCNMGDDAVLETVTARRPRVVLITTDRHNGGWQDMATVRRVHLAHSEIATILLVEAYDRELVVNTFRSGARGLFCFTQLPFRTLCKRIPRVAAGQLWANTEQMQYLIEVLTQVPSLSVINAKGDPLLTPREEQVVALVAEGLSNRDVAGELKLSDTR